MTSHLNDPAWINGPEDIFLDGYLKFYFVRQDHTRQSGTCFFRDLTNHKKLNALSNQDRVFLNDRHSY